MWDPDSNQVSGKDAEPLLSLNHEEEEHLPENQISSTLSIMKVGNKREKDLPQTLWTHYFLLHCFTILVYVIFSVIAIYARAGSPSAVSSLAPNSSFSEQRARSSLDAIASIGPRVCTSAAADDAIQMVADILETYSQEAKALPVDFQYEVVSQAGFQFGRAYGESYATATWHYNVTYVAARLDSRGNSSDCSLMVAHLDSVNYPSQGATDDAAGIGLSLELLRNLLFSPPAQNCYMFLFPSCERLSSIGSYAFANHHRWASQVKSFVTYENNGILDGPQLLVRGSGPRFITSRYFHASTHFKANSYVHDLGTFSDDILDSFSIFSNGSRVPGLDFTNFRNRWVENTVRDNINNIHEGSLQYLGNNLLPFFQVLSNLSDLNSTFSHPPSLQEGSGYLFFDFLGTGLFLTRSDFLALSFGLIFFHVVAGVGALFVMYRRGFKKRMLYRFLFPLFIATLSSLLSFGLGLSLPAFFGWVLSHYNPLFWYSSPFLAYMLYGSCSAFAILSVQALANAPFDPIRQTTKRNIPRFSFGGISITLAIVYLIQSPSKISWQQFVSIEEFQLLLISMPVSSHHSTQLGLFVLIFGFFTLVTLIFEYVITRIKFIKNSRLALDLTSALSLMINLSLPSWILLSTWNDLTSAVLPVMTDVHPGLLGVLFGFFSTLYLFPIVPLIRRAQQQKWLVIVTGAIVLILFIACSFVQPFSKEHPRRLSFTEVQVVGPNATIEKSYWSIRSADPYEIKSSVKKLHLSDEIHCKAQTCNATIKEGTDLGHIPHIRTKGRAKRIDFAFKPGHSSWQELMVYTDQVILEAQFENEAIQYNPEKMRLDFPIWKDGRPPEGYLFRIIRPDFNEFRFSVLFEELPTFSARALFWYTTIPDSYKEVVNKTDSLSDHIVAAETSNLVAVFDIN